MAFPSGKVSTSAYNALSSSILSKAKTTEYDAILLDLHGGMVTQENDDGEGELLGSLRKVIEEAFPGKGRVPIGVGELFLGPPRKGLPFSPNLSPTNEQTNNTHS